MSHLDGQPDPVLISINTFANIKCPLSMSKAVTESIRNGMKAIQMKWPMSLKCLCIRMENERRLNELITKKVYTIYNCNVLFFQS